MADAEEYFRRKASEFIERNGGRPLSAEAHGEALRLLLKEVSRDTRHACAEAVLPATDGTSAHNLAMNARPVPAPAGDSATA